MVDSFTIQGETNPGPTLEEQAAALDAKAAEVKDHGGLPSDNPEGETTLIAGKFKTQEDLVKAYKELESKIGNPKEEVSSKEEPAKDTNDLSIEKAEKAVEAAGLNLEELNQEYATNGALDEKSYEKLSKVGIPKDVVDLFIAGQEALRVQAEQTVYNAVGGKENYADIASWAAEALPEAEINAFNKAVNSNDADTIMMAVNGLKARYDAAGGAKEPSRVLSGKGSPVSTYRSVAEMTRDMGDPRYKNDAAFRKDVQEKLARSNLF